MGGGTLFAGGLPNVTVVRIVEAILLNDGNIISPDGNSMAFGTGVFSSLKSLENYFKIASDAAGFTAVADNVKGVSLKNLHVSSSDDHDAQSSRSRRAAQPLSVMGDFGGESVGH
jgi:protocadherin Fat 1/2/3